MGLNEITEQRHTINAAGTQLSDRRPALPRS